MPSETITRENLKQDTMEVVEEAIKRLPAPVVPPASVPVAQEWPSWMEPLRGLEGPPGEGKVIEQLPDGKYKITLRQEQPLEADMRAAILTPIETSLNPLTGKFPAGSVVVGGTVGLIIGEIVDGFWASGAFGLGATLPTWAVKLATAGIIWWSGKYVMSRQATTFATAVVVFQAVADFLPIDRIVSWFTSLFSGLTGGLGLNQTQFANALPQHQGSPIGAGGEDAIGDIF